VQGAERGWRDGQECFWSSYVLVEKLLAAEPGVKYPRCVEGERAGPPEDCGGSPGYENLLEAVRDPKHEEHEDSKEWLGDEFDPEVFDLAKVNKELRSIR
jgi:hypothetical protein